MLLAPSGLAAACGSSPRARGDHVVEDLAETAVGFIPARAGGACSCPSASRSTGFIPTRAGGRAAQPVAASVRRFIPARGVGSVIRSCSVFSSGSSPRVRGGGRRRLPGWSFPGSSPLAWGASLLSRFIPGASCPRRRAGVASVSVSPRLAGLRRRVADAALPLLPVSYTAELRSLRPATRRRAGRRGRPPRQEAVPLRSVSEHASCAQTVSAHRSAPAVYRAAPVVKTACSRPFFRPLVLPGTVCGRLARPFLTLSF